MIFCAMIDVEIPAALGIQGTRRRMNGMRSGGMGWRYEVDCFPDRYLAQQKRVM